VSQGRDQQAAPAHRRRIGWRGPLATLLIVLGCALAPLSVVGVWAATQISSTDAYVATVSPLISKPSIQRAITDRATKAVTAELDVQKRVTDAAAGLSQRGLTRAADLLDNAAGPIASGVNGFIHDQTAKVIASPQTARLWTGLNRRVHAQLVKILSGQGSATLTVVNGQVTLNLGPVIDQVKKNLSAKGLTAAEKLPPVNPTFPLFSAQKLEKLQGLYRLVNSLKIVLPIVAVVLLGLGVLVAHGHRRALIGAGLGLAASMLILGIALALFRGIYLGKLPAGGSSAAAADAYDTLVGFIKDALRALLAAGLIVAIGAFFTGPSATAVKTRGAFKSGLRWVREGGERAGVSTGPVGRWTYTHRKALRVSAVAIAALVFVFWAQPTWVVGLVIAIVLVLVLGLIELIGRPPAAPAAGHPAAGLTPPSHSAGAGNRWPGHPGHLLRPARSGCRGVVQDLVLAPLVVGIVDDPAVVQVGQLGQFVGGAAAGLGAVRRVLRLRLGDLPVGHLAAACDQVHEHAQERQDDREGQPAGLAQPAQVAAPEDVHDHPEQQDEPQDPQEEPHD
jgi:hypothetical protein